MRRHHGTGFTILEILLALAVGGMILTAVTFQIYSFTNIWLHNSTDNFFPRHVDGLTLFLNNMVALSEGLEEENPNPVSWTRPPGYSDLDDPLLTFQLRDAPPLLVWPGAPLAAVTCHLLYQRDSGLSLLWHSRLQETEDLDDARNTLLSPYVTQIRYCYYDAEDDTWDKTETPEEDDSGQFLLPQFLEIRFAYEDEERQTAIYLPDLNQNVPLF